MYDEADYIRSYEEYIKFLDKQKGNIKMKVVTLIGTRPEIIKLAQTIKKNWINLQSK